MSEESQIEKFFDVHKDRVITIYDCGEIKGTAFYFKLYDETLTKIKNREIDLTDINVIKECFEENGDNIHFFSVVADGIKTILQGIKTIKDEAKTISWFSPCMTSFFIRRIQCHH